MDKRKIRKPTQWMAIIAIAWLLSPLSAHAGTYGDLTYTSDGFTITITDCAATATNVVIPDTLEGLPVTSIGGSAFYYLANLSGVTIPNSVTSIGYASFAGCTSLTDIIIPDSVNIIGNYAFYYCPLLTDITIPDSVYTIGSYAFQYCYGLVRVTIGVGMDVWNIGYNAFANCPNLTSLIVRMPTISTHLYDRFENLTDILLDNTVTNIDYGAFSSMYSLTNIIIGTNVTRIGDLAFSHCSSLTSITVPDSVTRVGDSAFGDCTYLASATLGTGVTNIGNWAFVACSNLTSVYFSGNSPAIGGISLFTSDTNPTIFYLPQTDGWGATYSGRPTKLWNPVMQLGTGYGATTNGFRFNITGTADIPIAVVACTNLAEGTWTELQSTTLTGGSLDFIDADWTNYPSRVYRIAAP